MQFCATLPMLLHVSAKPDADLTRLLQVLSSGNNSIVLHVDGAAVSAKPAKASAKL